MAGLMASQATPGRTICSITINSPDERDALMRRLDPTAFRFVEWVDLSRADWLASACARAPPCDALLISAHHDGRGTFYADTAQPSASMTLAELERLRCTNACPALSARLRTVWLFGCQTLPASDPAFRDRVLRLFAGAAVLYGFAQQAPEGAVAGDLLEQTLLTRAGSALDLNRPDARLLQAFSAYGMVAVPGLAWNHRDLASEVTCALVDEDRPLAETLEVVHRLLKGPTAAAMPFLDRVRSLLETLEQAQRSRPAVTRVLRAMATDAQTRSRWLAQMKASQTLAQRRSLIDLSLLLGWLSPQSHAQAMVGLVQALLLQSQISLDDIDLACSLPAFLVRELALLDLLAATASRLDEVGHAAIAACLGHPQARARILGAVTSSRQTQRLQAAAVLRHRPIVDEDEQRRVVQAAAAMAAGDSQAQAIDLLGRQPLRGPETLETLMSLYARTSSAQVQSAIAAALLRADRSGLDSGAVADALTRHRLAGAGAGSALISHLLSVLATPLPLP
jgi:hypothetical protein